MKKILALYFGLLLCSPVGAQTIGPAYVKPPNSIDITLFGASAAASDNATALQAAINAAITGSKALYIPSAATCYKYTAPLTISGNLSIIGDYVSGNWNSGINVPLGAPPISGSVLCPSSNGSDAIDITGNSQQVNISNIGILFQTPFVGTGDGIHCIPTGINQGLSNSFWQNVMVYGHDGNHYAYNLQNPIYGAWNNVSAFGGGVLKIVGNSTVGNYGNMTFTQLYGQVIVGGSAHGISLSASAAQRLALLTFIRPQVITDNVLGVTPGGNPPTSAQDIWRLDTNVINIRAIGADLETNVSSNLTLGSPAQSNDLDWAGIFTDAATINAPAWGASGIMYGPTTRNFNDTTSSGAGAVTGMFGFTGTHVSATSAVTYPALSTIFVAPPIVSTNVSATRLAAIYATGEIFTSSDITATQGIFVTGASLLGGAGDVVTLGGRTQLGSATLTVPTGGLGISKITADGVAPGAGGAKLQLVCGTTAGTAKLVISAGTSATALTILDNIGAGVTGC